MESICVKSHRISEAAEPIDCRHLSSSSIQLTLAERKETNYSFDWKQVDIALPFMI